jgi:regulator of replication initiation timing
MSFTPIEDAAKSNQELEALLVDVQRLLHKQYALRDENETLKARVAEQDRLMETAHQRLISMLKRLPAGLEIDADADLDA